MGHDTVDGLPRTMVHSRRTVGARRVPADYKPSTRSHPGRSGAHHPGFALATVLTLATLNGLVQAAGPPPVVVDSIEPTEIVQGHVPQPELTIFGSNFIEGLPNKNNRPTVTLRQPGKGGAEFSALAWVNMLGTVATLPADLINLLQAPLGVYDVIVTRPTDGASGTLEGAFTVTDGQPKPGEIALVVRSVWGGPVNDVEVVGNLAYAAIGRRLVILDVADPTNPVEVGSLNIMAGVEGVAVRDGYAFLGAHKPYRFCVADVSDPTNPVLVSAGTGEQFSHDVQLYGDLAYVRGTNGQLIVIDVTDPQNTISLGDLLSDAAAIAIVGDLLYVGTSTQCCQANLKIYDLASDPLNPALLGSLNNVGEKTTALAVEGDYAYWAIRHNGGWFSLEVVDVSDPASPSIVDTELGFVWVRDVAVSGDYAYVADATGSGNGTPSKWALAQGLVVFDIATDPANPTVVSTFKTHGDVQGVEVVGDRAYLLDAGEGLIILDVSDPTEPVRLGNYHSPAGLRQMERVGDLLYIADAWNGFTILNVADTSHPQVLGVYLAEHYNDLGVNAFGIDVRDNLVYLGAGHLGLEVVDVNDPGSPIRIGEFRIPPPAVPECGAHFAAINVWGDDPRYASIGYEEATCGWVGGVFLNLDVSDPANIFEVGRIPHGAKRASTIELNSQGAAFIGRGSGAGQSSGEELTIDTSLPELPYILLRGDIAPVADVALEGDTLYLANDESGPLDISGLYIQDVTDPANPVLLMHVNKNYPLREGIVLNAAYAVAARGDRVYTIGAGCGPAFCGSATYLFDVSDPMSPLAINAVHHVGGSGSAVFVDEPFVCVTTEFTGPTAPNIGLVVMEVMGLNPVGDLDGDGSVGVSDLLILLASWGPCPPKGDCTADLNDDGNVGVADLLILLANWG